MATPLALAHIEAQRRLREAAKQGLTRIWQALPGYDRANVDQWLAECLPLVESAQRASVTLTQSYLARSIERPPVGVDPGELIGAAVRGGTPPKEVYQRPFIATWADLAAGKIWQEAVNAGLARAISTAATDVQLSMRATANAVQEADDGIFGYERVADGDACTFCSEVDGAYTKSADAAPLHPGCGCGLEPLTAPHPRSTTLPSGVAVHQHGELGPVLTAPDQHFTTESQALA